MHKQMAGLLAIVLTLAIVAQQSGAIAPVHAAEVQVAGDTAVFPAAPPPQDDALGPEQRNEEGGYAFRPVVGYAVDAYGREVFMSAPDADPDSGPMFVLGASAVEGALTLEDAYATLTSDIEDSGNKLSETRNITVDGVPGLAVDVSGTEEGKEVVGRLVVAMTGEQRGFYMLGAASPERWQSETEGLFEAVLASIRLFPPTNEIEAPDAAPTPTSAPAESQADVGATVVREADGMTMVYVPAGEFLMGSPTGKGEANEHPQLTVTLDAFWIDRTEVTNAQYRGCLEAGVCEKPAFWDNENYNGGDQPVVAVTWNHAKTYCEWAGTRLPTEAEWEKAARGTDGRRYPWGDQNATCEYAVMRDGSGPGCGQGEHAWPVGSNLAGASPYGALDMAGNVWEWVADWYDAGYYEVSPQQNPTGPESGDGRGLRGGSWGSESYDDLRSAFRFWNTPDFRHAVVGFRCAATMPAAAPPAETEVEVVVVPTPVPQPTPTPVPPTVLPAPTEAEAKSEAAAGATTVREADGTTMVYVPAGEFLMGSLDGEGQDHEHPQHTVYLDAFWIDRTEVTNAQYRRCVETGMCYETPCSDDTNLNADDQPAVCVGWDQATAYCGWAGARLPSEAEWEKAARGSDGRIYPWGNEDSTCELANYMDCVGKTAPVGSYPAGVSPYGALDMAGNAFEWVADWYADDYYARSPQQNPAGPDSGEYRVLRGGSWTIFDGSGLSVRSALRIWGLTDDRYDFNGFRCAGAMSAPVPPTPSEIVSVATPTSVPPMPTPESLPTPAPPMPTPELLPTPTPPMPTPMLLPTPTPTPLTWTRPTDGSVMVAVPAGEFLMGSPDGEGDDDEHPQHSVTLDAFWIDRTEVTNRQFEQFVQHTGYLSEAESAGQSLVCLAPDASCQEVSGANWRHPEGPDSDISDRMDHPVVQVSWNDAVAYCQWAGVVLPTEAEWEKAARGTDGRTYPWGNDFDSSRLNYCDSNCPYDWKDADTDDGYAGTAPVGSYPTGASPYGALDMAGNAEEWVADWSAEDYYGRSPTHNPQGPDSGEYRGLRGGSCGGDVAWVRSASRNRTGPDVRSVGLGFRCVAVSSPRVAPAPTSVVVADTATPVPPTPTTALTPTPVQAMMTPQPPIVASAVVSSGSGGGAVTPAPPTATVTPAPTSGPAARTYSIAFSRWDGTKHNLYTANPDGSGETFLLERAAGPSWSPDKRYVAFYGQEGVDRQTRNGVEYQASGISNGIVHLDMRTFSRDITQMQLVQDVREATGRWAAWSPDSRMIAFDARRGGPDWHIYILNLSDGQEIASIPGEQADWSPNAGRLVYRSGRNNQQGLWISNRDDSNADGITKDGSDSFPRWSFDGSEIAFHRDSGGNVDIYVMTLEDGNIRRLTDAAGIDTLPAWTPDGRIIFRSTRSGSWGIYIMNADGSRQKEIIPNADPGPDWAFGHMDAW